MAKWRKALGMFQKHETTLSHKDSVALWNSSKSSLPLGNIVQQIQRESSEMVGDPGIPFCTDDWTVESHIKVSFPGMDETFEAVRRGVHAHQTTRTLCSPVKMSEVWSHSKSIKYLFWPFLSCPLAFHPGGEGTLWHLFRKHQVLITPV